MADGVEPTSPRRADPLHGPAVPRLHVGQLGIQLVFEGAHPEQPEIREHEGLVDSLLVHQVDPGAGVVIVGRQCLEGNIRRESRTLPDPSCAHRHDVPGRVDLRQVDVRAVGGGQPCIAQGVPLNANGQVPARLGKVRCPQRIRFEEMGIGIDHDSWHSASVEKDTAAACAL